MLSLPTAGVSFARCLCDTESRTILFDLGLENGLKFSKRRGFFFFYFSIFANKGEVAVVHVMKDSRGSRSLSPLILSPGTGGRRMIK